MSDLLFKPRGLTFEEFTVGDQIMSGGRTITESDIVSFAGLTGDFNFIHTDAHYAANYMFGKRIAHGMLVQSIATGLAVQLGIIEGTILAFRDLSCKFSRPVYIGDTIRVKIEIKEKKEIKRLGGGNILMKASVLNQDDVVVQRGEWTMLIRSAENK